jgi:hypothetical protein
MVDEDGDVAMVVERRPAGERGPHAIYALARKSIVTDFSTYIFFGAKKNAALPWLCTIAGLPAESVPSPRHNHEQHTQKETERTMSAEEIATAFVQHFYQTFDSGVDALAGLFVSFRIDALISPVFVLASPLSFDH